MTKYLTATLVALVVSMQAFAGTFVVPPNATISGNPDGTVTWAGVALSKIVHFKDVNAAPVEHNVNGMSGSFKLKDVAANGGRFQVRDGNGNWAWLTPQGTRFNLVGVHLDCSNHDGCAMEVNGTGPKSPPVAHHQGGVYQGYQPAQQLGSTNQSVGVNTTQMTAAPIGGAVVTPVTMVPSPAMVGGTQSANYQRIGDRLVPIAAETRTWAPAQKASAEAKKAGVTKPAAKAPTVAKAEQCVPGKKFTMNGKEYLCAVLATEPVTPPVAPTAVPAPAAPPAATAPAAPAAKKG